MSDALAEVLRIAAEMPPKSETLAAILVAPTHEGNAYQIDGGKNAPACAASVVAWEYARDAFQTAERYQENRILIVPPAFEKMLPLRTGTAANLWHGVPVIQLRALVPSPAHP